MKKLAAILLLLLLSFNWIGYRWVMNWIQKGANTRLEARLDTNDYDEASLIEIKIPLDLPYQTDWADFERYDGEINLDGIHYKYVKRKVQDGMLILKCIPNESKHQIESARDYFYQLVNDLQDNKGTHKSENSKSSAMKFSGAEYVVISFTGIQNIATLQTVLTSNGTAQFIVSRPHASPEQPPDA